MSRGHCYRVTIVTPDGARWQFYFSTRGFNDPARLDMDKDGAAAYALTEHPRGSKVVRVVELHRFGRRAATT